MQPRAHIDHLIGYDNTNIFLILIPSQRKIITNKYVMFDENSDYVRDEVDLMQLIEEPMLKKFNVSNIPSSTVMDDISPDDEITIPSVHQPDNPSD